MSTRPRAMAEQPPLLNEISGSCGRRSSPRSVDGRRDSPGSTMCCRFAAIVLVQSQVLTSQSSRSDRSEAQGVPVPHPPSCCPMSKAASRARSAGDRLATKVARGSAFGSASSSVQRGVQRREDDDGTSETVKSCNSEPSASQAGRRGFESHRPLSSCRLSEVVDTSLRDYPVTQNFRKLSAEWEVRKA
jgi:hypothetical protein